MLPLHGQPKVNATIRAFLANPTSRAFLLHGPTGTGKTTTAHNLAEALGIDRRDPVGGFDEIASGEQTADAVRALARTFRLRPMSGVWRLVVINECDTMAKQAEAIWLDVLESLPPNVVIVFTTNSPEKLSARFSDRCKSICYECSERSIAAFARERWEQLAPGIPLPKTLTRAGCRPERLPSYRLAVSDVEDALADHFAEQEALADASRETWIVHNDQQVWGTFAPEQETDARDFHKALSTEFPGMRLSRTPSPVQRGAAVPQLLKQVA